MSGGRVSQGFEQRLLGQLLRQPSCSEYELLKHFQRSGEPGFPPELFRDSLLLFRAHFRLFHALYRLRQQLLEERRYLLDISPLQILLRQYRNPCGSALDEPDLMQDYYLDPSRLEETSRADVERMLGDFWARLGARNNRTEALRVLGLDEPADRQQIRRRYRELAMRHHPDRGGDLERFQELQAAMAVLRAVD